MHYPKRMQVWQICMTCKRCYGDTYVLSSRMISTCKGMVYLESKGIIHRDLACRNILVHSPSFFLYNNRFHKLMASILVLWQILACQEKQMSTNQKLRSFQFDGNNIIFYSFVDFIRSAPEVLKKHAATSKSDVFSFGIVIQEILTFGETPYEFLRTNKEVMEYVCAGRVIPKTSSCPDELYAIMLKCWKEEPSERPSFKEILDMLNEIRGQKAQEAVIGNQEANNYYKVTDENEVEYSTTNN